MRQVRSSVGNRGYGAQWQAIRSRKLEQDPICEPCQSVRMANLRLARVGSLFRYRTSEKLRARSPRRAEIVDHLIPLPGGTHDLENLMSVCRGHHGQKTAWEIKHGQSRGTSAGWSYR